MFDMKLVTSRAATDCGACCMTSLLDYYGIEASLEDVKKAAPAKLQGWSAGDLIRTAKKFGLDDAKAFKSSAEDVLNTNAPAICHWSFNHWIVYCGTTDDGSRVYICNPSRGRYTIDRDFFISLFSAYVIYGELVD